MRPDFSIKENHSFRDPGFRALLFLFILGCVQSAMPGALAHAQGHVLAQRPKATDAVIEASRRGEVIEVGVEFEAEDIHQEEGRKLRARGLDSLDEELKQEARINYARLKKSVFDAIRAEGLELEIIRDTENVPATFVRIRSYKVLERLLKDPRIKAVHENREISPAG